MIYTQELIHGSIWHSHDDTLALWVITIWVIVIGLSFIGITLLLEKAKVERRNE